MPRFRHLPKHEKCRCRECSKSGYGNYFVSATLCKRCAAKRRRGTLIHTVQLSQKLAVTQHVEKRLRKSAEAEVPKSLGYYVGNCAPIGTMVVLWFLGIGYALSDLPKLDNEDINVLFGLAWLLLSILTCVFLLDVSFNPVTKRKEQVKRYTLQLAAERAKQIQRRQVFYSSLEWQLLRDRVIGEEGKRCNNCRRKISKGVDVTVDHILPLSKYPDLALRRDNLRVLCRSCNSTKGNRD
jgi:hypothetical protein